jgi:cytochrome c553
VLAVNKTPGACGLLWLVAACSSAPDHPARRDVIAPAATYATEIVTPVVLRGLPMPQLDAFGQPTVTPCTTCHGDEDTSPLPESAAGLRGPHAGLSVKHGTLRCASCHDAVRRDRLHLADARSLALIDAMELCAQCHGPQKRDYLHGAHGGMRGHWDLSRGPRQRNHCVACHDPHAPAFGKFMPMPGPRDRFTSAAERGFSPRAQRMEATHD